MSAGKGVKAKRPGFGFVAVSTLMLWISTGFASAALFNCGLYAGGFRVCPQARFDDGFDEAEGDDVNPEFGIEDVSQHLAQLVGLAASSEQRGDRQWSSAHAL